MKNVKILSLIFTLVLMFSLCAVSVFATADTTAAAAAESTEAPAAEAEKAAEEEAEEDKGFMFEPLNFVKNLKYMGVGMLCIIIVIGVLIGVTLVLNKVTAPKK